MALTIKPIKPAIYEITIKGTSPLIQHKWSNKGLNMLAMTAAERKKQPKVARNPEQDTLDATYFTPDGEYAIPLMAFKAAVISAAHKDLGIEKTLVRKSLFIPNEFPGMLAPMVCSDPILREDIVRVGQNQTDIRHRPMFEKWSVRIPLQVDEGNLSLQNVIDLITRAGFSVGIGEWRPEKGGEFGRFEVDTSVEIIVR